MFTFESTKKRLIGQLELCVSTKTLSIYPNNQDYELLASLETLSQIGLMTSCGFDSDGAYWYSVTQPQLDELLRLFRH